MIYQVGVVYAFQLAGDNGVFTGDVLEVGEHELLIVTDAGAKMIVGRASVRKAMAIRLDGTPAPVPR